MRKMLLLLFCLTPLLSGCIAAAIVGGATAGGAIIYDKRSIKTMNQDQYATELGQALVNRSKILKGRSHISVATFDHVMLMVGQAQNQELKDYAYKLLKDNVKNVKRIYNEVTIAGGSTFLERTSDSWLTTKVKTAMLTAKHLRSSQIKVVTEASTVYLMGLVSHKQGELAGNVARRVGGVKKVVKVFEYT